MELTKQAKIALAGMVIGLISILIPYGPVPYNVINRIGEAILYSILTVAVVYTVQCQTEGSCHSWAMFIAIYVLIVNIFNLLFHSLCGANCLKQMQ